MANRRKMRREQIRKSKKRNNIIKILVVLLFVTVLAVFIIYNLLQSAKTVVYSDGYQIVQLMADKTFTASLYHEKSYNGSYTKSSQNGTTVIMFTIDGETISGEIDGNQLHLPHEWEDDHGHGGVMVRQK